MKDLSRKLYCLRALHQYTQAYVAKQIGVSPTIYVGIEKDASGISIKRLESIAALYNLTLENLFAFGEKDLVDLIKGSVPAIIQESFLPQMLTKLDAINKLLYQLVQHSLLQLQNNKPKAG